MSVRDFARDELVRAKFPEDEIEALMKILDIFFDTWDSGGAVSVMAPVLQRLIACKPLSPLTGAEDEWNEVDDNLWQNRRCYTVFRARYQLGDEVIITCYDIDVPGRPPISFPYSPDKAVVPSPVIEVRS